MAWTRSADVVEWRIVVEPDDIAFFLKWRALAVGYKADGTRWVTIGPRNGKTKEKAKEKVLKAVCAKVKRDKSINERTETEVFSSNDLCKKCSELK